MSTAWLADAHHESFWPHHSWSEFAALSAGDKARMLVVLPVHGFADHGLGLPLDAEESLGSGLLRRAAEYACAAKLALTVLPPLQFVLAPYPSARFGIDAETAYDQMCEIARSVKEAGFGKIVFFNTSPWNEELVTTVALDTRVELGLRNFVINLSGLGMSFHSGAKHELRARAQCAAMHVVAQAAKPASVKADLAVCATKADVRDADFRPGNFQQPASLAPDASLNGAAILDETARHIAKLLCDADAFAAQTSSLHKAVSAHERESRLEACATKNRSHYLPAFTASELAAIPDKQNALVIIPTGAIEQHGRHLPVGVDAILGQAWLANTLPKLPASAAARVFVAPPVTFGKSNEHDGFPGTVTISAKTLRRVLLALAKDLHAMGFGCIAILNTHGGNSPVIVSTLREIQTTLGMRAGMLKPACETDMAGREKKFGFHAGEWETSLMLACAPELVRMGKAVCEYPEPLEKSARDGGMALAWMTRDVSKSGVMGDATRATAENGARWLDAAGSALAARIVELLA